MFTFTAGPTQTGALPWEMGLCGQARARLIYLMTSFGSCLLWLGDGLQKDNQAEGTGARNGRDSNNTWLPHSALPSHSPATCHLEIEASG